jgi:hypothetical protein
VKAKRNKSIHKSLIITAILLALAVTFIVIIALSNKKEPPIVLPATQETSVDVPGSTNISDQEKVSPSEPSEPSSVISGVDPSTLTSVDVEPMGVTVYYSKGTPGFDFAVKRAVDSTQYAEFSSEDLIGTKCTDDSGLFASIIKNPTASEDQTTISQTVVVGEVTYGLSLAGKNCASDVGLLEKYQSGFINGFFRLAVLD